MPVSAVLTSDQFSALPDQFDKNGNRIRQELISGQLVETPPSFEIHNVVKSNIIEVLIALVVTTHDTFVPDASVINRARLSPRKQKYTPGAPELAIEIVSPSDTAIHLKSKVDIYLQGGSKTDWGVFPVPFSSDLPRRHSSRAEGRSNDRRSAISRVRGTGFSILRPHLS